MAIAQRAGARYQSAAHSPPIPAHLEELRSSHAKKTFTYPHFQVHQAAPCRGGRCIFDSSQSVAGIIATTWQAQAARHEKAQSRKMLRISRAHANYSKPNRVFASETTVKKL